MSSAISSSSNPLAISASLNFSSALRSMLLACAVEIPSCSATSFNVQKYSSCIDPSQSSLVTASFASVALSSCPASVVVTTLASQFTAPPTTSISDGSFRTRPIGSLAPGTILYAPFTLTSLLATSSLSHTQYLILRMNFLGLRVSTSHSLNPTLYRGLSLPPRTGHKNSSWSPNSESLPRKALSF